jgi:N6-L-threonylcarbamoyladenine synthase
VVVGGTRVLSSVIASQVDLHAQWGGIVPEAAARAHVEQITPVIDKALSDANTTLDDIEGIAVTNRPGLAGALVVGVTAAKALAFARDLPMVGVHHLEGHIYSAYLSRPELATPFLCLAVSGGHTELIRVDGLGQYTVLGQTLDDAAGEAFDKGARVLGLGYPGGAEIDKAAREGNPKAISFPRSFPGDGFDFSFSGLKTSVLRFAEKAGPDLNVPDAAASLQQAIVDVLVERTASAAEEHGLQTVALVGGVAANSSLRVQMAERLMSRGHSFVVAPLAYCTDNAAMIGAAGHARLVRGDRDRLSLDVSASAPLPSA